MFRCYSRQRIEMAYDQVNNVMEKVFGKLAPLRRLKVFLDPSTLNTTYKALAQPHFDYCTQAWNICPRLILITPLLLLCFNHVLLKQFGLLL